MHEKREAGKMRAPVGEIEAYWVELPDGVCPDDAEVRAECAGVVVHRSNPRQPLFRTDVPVEGATIENATTFTTVEQLVSGHAKVRACPAVLNEVEIAAEDCMRETSAQAVAAAFERALRNQQISREDYKCAALYLTAFAEVQSKQPCSDSPEDTRALLMKFWQLGDMSAGEAYRERIARRRHVPTLDWIAEAEREG